MKFFKNFTLDPQRIQQYQPLVFDRNGNDCGFGAIGGFPTFNGGTVVCAARSGA